MPKASQWREIFRIEGRGKVQVRVGDKNEEMTTTQAYRFDELLHARAQDKISEVPAAPRKTRYGIAEASSLLKVSEADLLQRGESGSVNFFVNVAGVGGRWLGRTADGRSRVTSIRKLMSGYLSLTSRSCGEILSYDSVNVSVLEFHCPSDPSFIDLDREAVAALSAWKDCEMFFCLREPLWIDRYQIVLLAPLRE